MKPCSVFVVVIAALGLVSASSASAARVDARAGTITARVTAVTAARAKVFRPSITVTAFAQGGGIVQTREAVGGRFRVSVPPGLYGVVTSGYSPARPVRRGGVVLVKAGRTVAFPAPRRTTATAIPATRVSVGQVTLSVPNPTADDRFAAAGMRDLMTVDLLSAMQCSGDAGVYEDRTYGRYGDVLKELRFMATSPFADPAGKAQARAALRNLPNVAPTVRVNGTITELAATTAAAEFRIVNMKTGKVEWSRTVHTSGDTAAFDLSSAGMKLAGDFLCNRRPPLPTGYTLSSTTTATDENLSEIVTWTVNATATFQRPAGATVGVVSYQLTSGNATVSGHLTPKGGICGPADFTGVIALPSTSPSASSDLQLVDVLKGTFSEPVDTARPYHYAIDVATGVTLQADQTCQDGSMTTTGRIGRIVPSIARAGQLGLPYSSSGGGPENAIRNSETTTLSGTRTFKDGAQNTTTTTWTLTPIG